MKKEWIVEAVYIMAALVFIGICITYKKEPVEEVFGNGVTATPAIEAIYDQEENREEKPEENLDEKTNDPDDENSGESTLVTSAPVQDAIPTPEVQNPDEQNSQGASNEQGEQVTPGVQDTPDVQDSQTAPDTQEGQAPQTPETEDVGRLAGGLVIKNENYQQYSNEKFAWWFRRKKDHSPSGSGEGFPIAPFDAYYLDTKATKEDQVVYLTFDCGYENGFTPAILDTLSEKNVTAMFFVTKDFVRKNPEYVKRMKEKQHLVGNHTVRHLSSPDLTPEELEAELLEVAKTMEELTGYKMDPFFRPPMGEYSERTLKVTQDMGYTSVFWSIAYLDYDVKYQPGKDYVVDHFNTYHHNGTVVLMHNTSESNMQALGEVVDLLHGEGYRFADLTELAK